jgi:hypothetical protein
MRKISRIAAICVLTWYAVVQSTPAIADTQELGDEGGYADNSASKFSFKKASFLQELHTRSSNNQARHEEKPGDDGSEPEEEDADPDGDFFHHAEFNVLNKYSAKLSNYKVRLGESARVGRFVIRPLTCWKESNQRLYQESRIRLEVYRVIDAQNELKMIYSGWFSNRHSSLTDFTNDVIEILPISCE